MTLFANSASSPRERSEMSSLRKIRRKIALASLARIRFPAKLSLRQKSDLVVAMIEEKQNRLMLAQEQLLTAEALQARKEAEDAAIAEVPAPEGL